MAVKDGRWDTVGSLGFSVWIFWRDFDVGSHVVAQDEHERFLLGVEVHGRFWKQVATVVGTRTPGQVRSHAQKHDQRLAKEKRDALTGASGWQGAEDLPSAPKRGGGRPKGSTKAKIQAQKVAKAAAARAEAAMRSQTNRSPTHFTGNRHDLQPDELAPFTSSREMLLSPFEAQIGDQEHSHEIFALANPTIGQGNDKLYNVPCNHQVRIFRCKL